MSVGLKLWLPRTGLEPNVEIFVSFCTLHRGLLALGTSRDRLSGLDASPVLLNLVNSPAASTLLT